MCASTAFVLDLEFQTKNIAIAFWAHSCFLSFLEFEQRLKHCDLKRRPMCVTICVPGTLCSHLGQTQGECHSDQAVEGHREDRRLQPLAVITSSVASLLQEHIRQETASEAAAMEENIPERGKHRHWRARRRIQQRLLLCRGRLRQTHQPLHVLAEEERHRKRHRNRLLAVPD